MKGIMDAGNQRGLLRAGMREALKKSSGYFKRALTNKYIASGRKSEKHMLRTISGLYLKRGMNYAKQFLKDQYGFTQMQVDKGLVWDPDTMTVHIRGSLKDTLDYEFYGVPKGAWPNVRSLRKWVLTRVIPRDPGLQAEYNKMNQKGKFAMATDLTYKFGKAIHDHGLKRRSTTLWEKTDDPKMHEAGITVVFKGNEVTARQLTENEALGKWLPKTKGKYGKMGLKKEFR